MKPNLRIVLGQLGGETYPLDRRPVPEDGLGRRPSEEGLRLRRTLKAATSGDHFICDMDKRKIYRTASELGVSITMRRRKPDGWHVWVV